LHLSYLSLPELAEDAAEAPEAEWSYLKKGVVTKFPKFGLVRYEKEELDLTLIARSGR
jgi:hypothetical protein